MAWNDKREDPSYLMEMLKHVYSQTAFFSSMALSSILLFNDNSSIAALPMIAYGAVMSLAALFVPSSPTFRHYIDSTLAAERRLATRAYFINELSSFSWANEWQTFQRMEQRVSSLRQLAQQSGTAFSEDELERLADATIDYLGLCLARQSMYRRMKQLQDQKLDRKLRDIEQRLSGANALTRPGLEKARSDMQRLIDSEQRLETRATAAETAMLTMADALEEVYQGVMSNPASNEASKRLQQAVDEMRIEDDLSSELDEDLSKLLQRNAKAQKVGV